MLNDHPTQYDEVKHRADASRIIQATEKSTASGQRESFLENLNVTKVKRWVQYFVHNLRPFDSCENNIIVPHVMYCSMDADTFIEYVKILIKQVERKMVKEIPDTFAILMTGWTKAE